MPVKVEAEQVWEDIIIPQPFTELVSPSKKWRHLCFHGGRSSAKSTTVGTFLLVLGGNKKLRIACVRETQNSIADSVHQLLVDIIMKYKLPHWVITNDKLINEKTGTTIIFKGVHNNLQAIKSLEGVDICWVEEAQSVSQDSIDILTPTIRKEGSFFIWTFNRQAEDDPVWVSIAGHPDDRTYVKLVNSEDVEKILSTEIIADREKMRTENPELFQHVWMGEPLTANTGSVFGKQLALAKQDGRVTRVPYDASLGVYTAWDLGIGDCTAIWFFQVTDAGEIKFIDHYESSGEDLGHYIDVVKNKPYSYNTHFIPHDAEHRELQTGATRTQYFNQRGIYNLEVLRPTKYTQGIDDINLLARPKFSKCWFDEEKCRRGLECLRAYHFAYDEKNRITKAKPEHDWSSHSSSAFIYAIIAESENINIETRMNLKPYTPSAFRNSQRTGF